jgi:queuosine precursor transporter
MRGNAGMNKLLVVLYLAVIVCANVVTASFAPITFGALLVPAGSFLIGATFILRDLVQNAVGRGKTYITIGAAMLISALTSHLLGDMLWIVFASAVTFLVSETTDTEIYSRLKLPMAYRVLYSGIVGGLIDSILFVIIGLSPLFSGILPWPAVGYAILGQIIVKLGIQIAGALVAGYFTGASNRNRTVRQ